MKPVTQTKPPRRQRPLHLSAESVTFAIASLIVAILVGLVLFIWATQSNEDPILAVNRNGDIHAEQGYYYVPFSVTNIGGGTAEAVEIVAELRRNGEVEEEGQQQIDFLSSQEEQEGVFIFENDPGQGELTLRASGYRLP
ncbi:MAG: TIGR02588 family protein [Cyanobacteria bacterium Co-bin13]|nr:TIGR02588 family protein [Cyanobacteria bacterium Co-bin13]